jgi:hypothetical protein
VRTILFIEKFRTTGGMATGWRRFRRRPDGLVWWEYVNSARVGVAGLTACYAYNKRDIVIIMKKI